MLLQLMTTLAFQSAVSAGTVHHQALHRLQKRSSSSSSSSFSSSSSSSPRPVRPRPRSRQQRQQQRQQRSAVATSSSSSSFEVAEEVDPIEEGIGTHYAYIWVGTPPQRQSVILDTGSYRTAFPCEPCNSCGDYEKYHESGPFDPSLSSTYEQSGANA